MTSYEGDEKVNAHTYDIHSISLSHVFPNDISQYMFVFSPLLAEGERLPKQATSSLAAVLCKAAHLC